MERLADLPVPMTQQTLKCHYWQQDMTAGCSSLTATAPAPNFCFNWFRFPPRQFPCRTAEIFSFFPSWNFASLPGLLNYTLQTGFTVAYHLVLALLQTSGPRRPFFLPGWGFSPSRPFSLLSSIILLVEKSQQLFSVGNDFCAWNRLTGYGLPTKRSFFLFFLHMTYPCKPFIWYCSHL